MIAAKPLPSADRSLVAAEFFAGIGLVREALKRAEIGVVFANDIEPFKRDLYRANYSDADFVLGDIRNIAGRRVPAVDIATASFPCTDLSLAGWRRGLFGDSSSLFWEFARILEEMGPRRPRMVLIENVPGFLTSNGGADLEVAIGALNHLGYTCDAVIIDASWFVPQSRRRLFLVGALDVERESMDSLFIDPIRPESVMRFIRSRLELRMARLVQGQPSPIQPSLDQVVERLRPDDRRWWDEERTSRFVDSLSPTNAARVAQLIEGPRKRWATAYRRTRAGRSTWEIRPDNIAGCLRTARGGSSKQALVEVGRGSLHVRWLTAREYARLQGAPDYLIPEDVTENQALFGFGDAVCVPAVEWVLRACLRSAVREPLTVA